MADPQGSTERAIYVISVAAELAGVHPQTLRIYERKGLLHPERTAGNTRRYSERDIALLRKIQELTGEGINLAGVLRVLELEDELQRTRERYEASLEQLELAVTQLEELTDARDHMALVPLRDIRRIRKVLKADMLEQATRRRTFIAPPVG
jgi:MerR family transcriptional regulator/heat shock protein HspR